MGERNRPCSCLGLLKKVHGKPFGCLGLSLKPHFLLVWFQDFCIFTLEASRLNEKGVFYV